MSFRDLFEKQLRDKVAQKANLKQTEEAYIVKAFKFFDIYDRGFLTFP